MKLYAQGLARRLHQQRVGMTEGEMMQRPDGSAHNAPRPPAVLQDATECYNSTDVRERSGSGDSSKRDESTYLARANGSAGAPARARSAAPRLMENRIDASCEDAEPIDATLEFERRVARTVKPLSLAEENAIELIVLGHSDRSVANHCGVHRVTVTRWRLYNPAFRAELSRRRQEVAGATADGFRQLAASALVVMSKLLEDPSPCVRFRAARSVLAMTPRFAPPDEPIDVEGVLTAEARKLNVQLHETHPADCVVYEDERQRALDHLMRRAGEDYTVDEEDDEQADAPPPQPTVVEEEHDDEDESTKSPSALAPPTPSPCSQGEGGGEGSSSASEISDLKSPMRPLPTPSPPAAREPAGYREREPEGSNRGPAS